MIYKLASITTFMKTDVDRSHSHSLFSCHNIPRCRHLSNVTPVLNYGKMVNTMLRKKKQKTRELHFGKSILNVKLHDTRISKRLKITACFEVFPGKASSQKQKSMPACRAGLVSTGNMPSGVTHFWANGSI